MDPRFDPAAPATALVMSKFFGVTHQQALRVQALLRLGISEDDVRVAERLMAPRSAADRGAKVESLLGCTTEQMSYKKALEVLGITQAMMDDERAKILGSLGVKAWSNPEVSTGGVVDREGNIGSCGSLFRKRRHVLNEPGAAPMCGLAPSSHTEADTDVIELEDTCFSQYLRIQQLELQVAALAESSADTGNKK